MNILDWLTVLSYLALNVDVILQIKRIHKTKSSKDLSLMGMSIRYIAILILLLKFLSISSLSLAIGQALIAITFSAYFILAVFYVKHRPKIKK